MLPPTFLALATPALLSAADLCRVVVIAGSGAVAFGVVLVVSCYYTRKRLRGQAELADSI